MEDLSKESGAYLVTLDFFVVPTVTFRVFFVLVILAHGRRRVVHFHVTEHPTVQWTAQQVVEAFPWDEAPRYLLRDRDRIYGAAFRQRVRHLGIKEVLLAPQSLWQNPYVERLIGSIRRECLDHVIVLHERHLQRILTSYFGYYPRRIEVQAGAVVVTKYRHHWQNQAGRLIKRWDNAPHHPHVQSFPHHLHDGAEEQVVEHPSVDALQILHLVLRSIGSSLD